MTEKTLVLVKPDGVQKKIVGDIIARFEKVGLNLVALKMIAADQQTVEQHYIADEAWMENLGKKARASYEAKGMDFPVTDMEHGQKVRAQLMDYLGMGPVVAMVLEGEGAVKLVRKLVGSTEPASSAPGTIRGDHALESYQLADNLDRPVYNVIHASGEVEEAAREIPIWFSDHEIV
ncbi:MAG: nucleoside-diphosphate kinase [Patescibacteria group bacterium]